MDPDDLPTGECLPLRTVPFTVAAILLPSGHRLARRHSVRLADLAGADLVVPPTARPYRISLERALRAAGVPWSIAV